MVDKGFSNTNADTIALPNAVSQDAVIIVATLNRELVASGQLHSARIFIFSEPLHATSIAIILLCCKINLPSIHYTTLLISHYICLKVQVFAHILQFYFLSLHLFSSVRFGPEL